MRVAVIGSRGANDEHYNFLIENIPANCTEIVSGAASGADTLAEKFARENNLLLKIFTPDYKKYGRNATLVRNDEIVFYSSAVIALWDGISRGTAYVINKCIESGVPVKILRI